MKASSFPKVKSIVQLYELITEEEKIIVDVIRQIVSENLPAYCKEKISYNVPFFYGNRSICIIWPASIPRGGIKEGVLLGFWYGNRLKDENRYLVHGTNKQIFYKIFKSVEEIDEESLSKIIKEAADFDKTFPGKKK